MQNLNFYKKYIKKIVADALNEDIGSGDITANLIPKNKMAQAKIISREKAIIAGTIFVTEVFKQLNPKIKIKWFIQDGNTIKPNQMLCELTGPARELLSGERTALNFLQTLSGTATITRNFVDKIAKTKTILLDTRKTIPNLRLAQKYAVAIGGGKNHRLGLFDAFLIKENHITALDGSITKVINAARKENQKKTIEIEVQNLNQLKEAILAKANIVMLDNFNLAGIKKAVKINNKQVKLEVSGDVNLKNIRSIAETGVDYISVGSLTKHVVAINLSMLFTL